MATDLWTFACCSCSHWWPYSQWVMCPALGWPLRPGSGLEGSWVYTRKCHFQQVGGWNGSTSLYSMLTKLQLMSSSSATFWADTMKEMVSLVWLYPAFVVLGFWSFEVLRLWSKLLQVTCTNVASFCEMAGLKYCSHAWCNSSQNQSPIDSFQVHTVTVGQIPMQQQYQWRVLTLFGRVVTVATSQ